MKLEILLARCEESDIKTIFDTFPDFAYQNFNNVDITEVFDFYKNNRDKMAISSIMFLFFRELRTFQDKHADLIKKANAVKVLTRTVGLMLQKCAWFQLSDTGNESQPEPVGDEVSQAIKNVYLKALGRKAAPEEVNIWKENVSTHTSFPQFVNIMSNCDESQSEMAPWLQNGEMIQFLYEKLFERGASAVEIQLWLQQIESGEKTRADVIKEMFEHEAMQLVSDNPVPEHDACSCHVMGTEQFVTKDDWDERCEKLSDENKVSDIEKFTRFNINSKKGVLVTAVASLFKGGDFITSFLDNITSQNIFDDYVELIIIDADSPEGEGEVISKYAEKHPNIRYMKKNHCVGIYEAWNIGVQNSKGKYITNTNLDDLRREDSLELQAATLDSLEFVDVVYQDFYYTFDPFMDFSDIERMGYKSSVPVLTPHNMMMFNSPHNAPMWRKSLHDELGLFDSSFKSAGDYEFWMRCMAHNKVFYKIKNPHVAYYQNPKGLSTRPDTKGVEEAMRITRKYARKIMPEAVLQSNSEFLSSVGLSREPVHRKQISNPRYTAAQEALRALNIKYSTGM